MQISKAISNSGKKIIKAIKKLSPQARLAKKLDYEKQMRATAVNTRKDEKLSKSWWSLEKANSRDTLYTYAEVFECRCCCCQFADEENLRNENLENEMIRC